MMKRLLLTIALLCAPAWAGTCGAGYAYSTTKWIDHYQISATLTDYVAYWPGGTAFKTVANGGNVESATALDVIFCDAASAGNQLSHELVAGSYVELCVLEDENWPARFERLYNAQAAQDMRQLQIPASVREHLAALGTPVELKLIEGAS
jgi:hypothetical protein